MRLFNGANDMRFTIETRKTMNNRRTSRRIVEHFSQQR
jgi:hypothetical protein